MSEDDPTVSAGTAPVSWVGEVWREFRPFLVVFTTDLLVSCAMWFSLVLFEWLTTGLVVSDWGGPLIVNLHTIGAVVSFGLFAILMAVDVWTLHKNKLKRMK